MSANDWQMASQVYQSLARYEDALNAAERCIAMNPENPYGYVQASNSLVGLHRYDAAVRVIRRTPVTRPLDQTYVQQALARALAHAGSIDEGLRISDALLARDPTSTTNMFFRAAVLFLSGRPAEAADFYAAMNTKFSDAQNLCAEARARIAADQREKAESLILAGKQRRQREPLCWLAAGERFARRGATTWRRPSFARQRNWMSMTPF